MVCGQHKDINDFHWTGKRTGRRRQCKKCLVAKAKVYRNTNKEQYRRYAYKWHLNSRYGITLDDYDQMLTNQNIKCKICETEFDMNGQNRKPHVDHCHTTGKVRGILCFTCNTAIGKMKDDPELLRKAAEYLEED